MQLAFHNLVKAEYCVLNFTTKEFSDNWVAPKPAGDPNFDFGNQVALLSAGNITWKLDLQVPYNWADLNGGMLNAWTTRADIVATGWAPYGDADVVNIDEAAITFTPNGTVIVKQDNGTFNYGTYAIDEKTNLITFTGITPNILIASWVSCTTNAANQFKSGKVEKTAGVVTGIWLGQRSATKSEYMVFHFVIR